MHLHKIRELATAAALAAAPVAFAPAAATTSAGVKPDMQVVGQDAGAVVGIEPRSLAAG